MTVCKNLYMKSAIKVFENKKQNSLKFTRDEVCGCGHPKVYLISIIHDVLQYFWFSIVSLCYAISCQWTIFLHNQRIIDLKDWIFVIYDRFKGSGSALMSYINNKPV